MLDIRKEIVNRLKKLFDKDTNNDDSRPYWTNAVKKAVHDIGKEYKKEILVCGSHEDCDDIGWLFDLVWYSEEEKNGQYYLTSLELAMECEWNVGVEEIRRDFEKLLVCDAKIKLMICQAFNEPAKETLSKYFQMAIDTYQEEKTKKDKYLILIYQTYDECLYKVELD